MRDRRWRRLLDAEKGQERTAAATGGGVRGLIRTPHIVKIISIIGVPLVGVITVWFGGFFDSILHNVVPSGADTFCVLRENVEYHWPFATPATSDRFTILIAHIDHDDADHTYTRAVTRAFLKRDGIDRIETCRVLRLSGVGRDAETTAVRTARKWLEQRRADLLIGGELLKKDDAVSLWLIDKEPTHDWQPSTFRLDANLLKKDFDEAASTQLWAVAVSAIRPVTEQKGKYLAEILRPIAARLRHLLKPPTGFTATQNADLQYTLGRTLSVIGRQANDNSAISDAINAYNAALEERTRGRVPLDWAAAQNGLGIALGELGQGEEAGTARLNEAVVAFRAELEEYTRDRAPLEWAMTQNNLGYALRELGEREGGTARLNEAVVAFRAELEEYTRDRAPLEWAGAQNNLGVAFFMLGEREGGTAHPNEAVAAFRAALEEQTRDRAPLEWANTQRNLGIVLRELGQRESGTARLNEAVVAFRAALEEYTRDRAPRDWANTQNGLGIALGELGQRESGTARLNEAVVAFRAALEEYTRDRAPLHWATSTGGQGIALMLLAERLGDATKAETAIQQIEVALEIFRDRGNATAAAYFAAELSKARILFTRLTSH